MAQGRSQEGRRALQGEAGDAEGSFFCLCDFAQGHSSGVDPADWCSNSSSCCKMLLIYWETALQGAILIPVINLVPREHLHFKGSERHIPRE